MPAINTIFKQSFGDFTIGFSVKYKHFYISKLPEEISKHELGRNLGRKTFPDYDAALKGIDDFIQEYQFKELLKRKVIIIQLQTSVSDYKLEKEKRFLSLLKKGEGKTETVVSHDFLEGVEGFKLIWYVADEFEYAKGEIKYKVTDANRNNKHRASSTARSIHDIADDYHGECRIITYREDLHLFLKDLDSKITEMLKGMIAYFDLDTEKFISNFESTKLNLLGEAKQ